MQESPVFSGLGFKFPPGQKHFQILAALTLPCQLSYNQYNDLTMSVGRTEGEAEDWPPVFICRG